jgi:hypothetical protein
LPVVIDSEHAMKNTRRPQQAFAGGKRQGFAKPRTATNIQGPREDQAHWQRRRQYYLDLAESVGNADRVDRENYWQHAEHFHRLIAEAAGSHRHANLGAAPTALALAIP